MGFFKRLAGENESKKGTTQNFFIGAPEAEGESTFKSKIKLGEMFCDFLNIFPELASEKFIVSGRKGSGKSAIAEYILYSANNDANVFCEFVKTRDLDIQRIIQIGRDKDLNIEGKLLYEWIILTKLIKSFTEDQSVQGRKEFRDLSIFLKRNSGLVDIKSYEIYDIIRDKSFEVNIEYLNRAFNSVFKRSLGIKEHKAPFYKIIPNLKDIVIKLLQDTVVEGNEYFLIFDDLDIGFKEKDSESIDALVDLLRVTKDYNIDYFGKNSLNAGIVILIRDDIKRIIINNAEDNADTAKIFTSYEIPLIWYEHAMFKNDENSVGLKKMINKRIAANFELEKLSYYIEDPWASLIGHDQRYNESSFKYIIDYTFFRPRDLILFFKPLPTQAFKIPLSFENVSVLLKLYVKELVQEIKNELSALFDQEDIKVIFSALSNLKKIQPLSKQIIIDEFEKLSLSYDAESTIKHLFNYSIIGNIEHLESGATKVVFKHREKRDDPDSIDLDKQFIYHKAIDLYLGS